MNKCRAHKANAALPADCRLPANHAGACIGATRAVLIRNWKPIELGVHYDESTGRYFVSFYRANNPGWPVYRGAATLYDLRRVIRRIFANETPA